MTATKVKNFSRKTASLFRSLGQPSRLQILLAIGQEEACVCHLESVLGQRQAYISQQLMALRDAGLVTTRREGKYIFYRLQSPELLALIVDAARLAGTHIPEIASDGLKDNCACPTCSPQEVEILTAPGGPNG